MTSLTVDNATLATLSQAKELVEIRDPNGTVLGFFAPVALERAHLYAAAAAQIDPTEIQRRKATPQKTHTTQEVLEHLDSLREP
jgi:hypothetical protein